MLRGLGDMPNALSHLRILMLLLLLSLYNHWCSAVISEVLLHVDTKVSKTGVMLSAKVRLMSLVG